MLPNEAVNRSAFHLIDTMIERLSVLHQGSQFMMSLGGHMDSLKLTHRRHSSELEGIVFVGLAFDFTPLPSVFVGRANKGLESMAHGKVIAPP